MASSTSLDLTKKQKAFDLIKMENLSLIFDSVDMDGRLLVQRSFIDARIFVNMSNVGLRFINFIYKT
jgi:hypothetical protein